MKATTNGIETHYTIEGEGPWLTMSHSLACNTSMWDPQVKALARRFKVLRYDTRGHGGSGAPKGPYTLEQLADDAKALFDALGIKRTHWAGLSMGGMIGQTFALKYPGVFESMVLADTSARMPSNAAPLWAERVRIAREQGMEPLVEPTLARWFTAPYLKARNELVEGVARAIRETAPAGYAGACEAIAKLDVLDSLKTIDCPTLVIVGDQDPGTPPDMAREIHQSLPGSQLVIIPSAAHLSNMEQADAFNKALDAFYDRLAQRGEKS